MLNVILDLDNTIISALRPEEMKEAVDKFGQIDPSLDWIDMDTSYRIYERPGSQQFLDYIFSEYRVSVWTAASKEYAAFIVDNVILKKGRNRKIDYILFSHHCRLSKKIDR